MIRTAIKLGVFTAVCIGLTLLLAFRIGNISPLQDTYDLHATFDDVTGLLIDDNVKISGVVVGKVTGIEVERGQARVSFQVHDDVGVPADSAAAIRWRNLLGQRYVYLLPGDAPTSLQPGAEITRTESVVDLGELFNRLGPIVAAIDPEQVNQFLDATAGALAGNETALQETIADLASVTGTLAERDEAIARLVANMATVAATIDDRERQISEMLDNLVVLSSTFSANTDILDEAVTELGDFGEHLSILLGDRQAEVDDIMASLAVVVDVVRAKLDTIDRAVGNLPEGARRLFNASRYGTWLNQVIPCGAIGPIPLDDNCVLGPDQTGPPQEPVGPGAQAQQGAAAIAHLLAGTVG